MAFGQQSGPPASGRQLKDLQALLEQAGYASFREARGPLGFTQRQGGGKFSGPEAAAFIEQLEAELEAADGPDGESVEPAEAAPPSRSARARPAAKPEPKVRPAAAARPAASGPSPANAIAAERREARQSATAEGLPANILARELERRGWIVIPPEDLTATDPTGSTSS